MPRQKKAASDPREMPEIDMPPASTPDEQEKRLIQLAMNLAEKRLRSGEATSQEIVTLLRYGLGRENLEREEIKQKIDLARAKVKNIKRQEESSRLYTEALDAIRSYSSPKSRYQDEEDIY
jgi:hypothetical protein